MTSGQQLWNAFVNDPFWPLVALVLLVVLAGWGKASASRQRKRELAAALRASQR
jgi:hypothetical protein